MDLSKIVEYDVEFKFISPLLGTASTNKRIYRDFIASKAMTTVNGNVPHFPADEADLVQENDTPGMTGFLRDPLTARPVLSAHMIKGYLKEACKAMREVPNTKVAKLTAHQSKINRFVFVNPRYIAIDFPGQITLNERPLRAETAQGPRITLACSEQIEHAKIAFTLRVIGESISEDILKECFYYGQSMGIGQWRNANYGAFVYRFKNVREVEVDTHADTWVE